MDKLEKLLNKNHINDIVLGEMVSEYDIKSAGASVIRTTHGIDLYNKLMAMDKMGRNVYIGKMCQKDPSLNKVIHDKLLQWMNEFIEKNKIKPRNIIETTRDSIVLCNKLPSILSWNDVEFRNKDGEFSSFIRMENVQIFYNSLGNRILIKGIKKELWENNEFINKFLYKVIYVLEKKKDSYTKMMKSLQNIKHEYFNTPDHSIYKDVYNNNSFVYKDGETVHQSLYEIQGSTIVKTNNYINFLLPLIKIGVN